MRSRITAFLAFVACATTVPAAGTRLVVVDLVSWDASPRVCRELSDRLRMAFVREGGFDVPSRDSVQAMLERNSFRSLQCLSSECAGIVGQMTGARYVVVGSISESSSSLTASVRLVYAPTGTLDGSVVRATTRTTPAALDSLADDVAHFLTESARTTERSIDRSTGPTQLVTVVSGGATPHYPMRFGIAAGASYSTFDGADATPNPILGLTKNTRTAPMLRVYIEYPLGASLAVRPEISWISKGVLYDYADGPGTELRIDYIEMPVLLEVLDRSGSYGPFLVVGPYAAYRLRATQIIYSSAGNIDTDFGYRFKRWDSGFVFGAGFAYRQLITTDARMEFGIPDIDRTSQSMRNFAVVLEVGVIF